MRIHHALAGFGVALSLIGVGVALKTSSGDGLADARRPSPATAHTKQSRIYLTEAQAHHLSDLQLLPRNSRSILNVDQPLNYGQSIWNTQGASEGRILVRIDLRTQVLSVFRGRDEIGTVVFLYGARGHETPIGRFPVLAKFRDHNSSTYDAPMPYTLQLTHDGVSIHGSNVRPSVATHGCIGIPLEFAHQLFDAIKVGDSVEIARSEPRRMLL